MRIKKIFIKNLNSLKGEHEIDFEKSPLLDSELVAIVGATGSGKSTILDAILLALFNQTPRYSKVSTSELQATGGLVTKGEKEAIVYVDYDVIINGEISSFRSRWSASKGERGDARNRINSYHMELVSLPNENIIEEGKGKAVVDRTKEIIGLDYEQFVKGVMLSQGDFSKFLKSKASDRHELLEKITKTFDFRNISKAVYEEYKRRDTIVKELKNKLDSIEILSAEEKETLEFSILEHQNALIILEKTLTEARKHKTLLEQIDQEKNKLILTERKIQDVAQEKEDFQSQEAILEKHEKALPLQGTLSNFLQKQTRLKELEEALHSLEVQKKNKEQRISELQEEEIKSATQLKEFISQEEILESLWTKVEELDAQISLLEETYKQNQHLLQQKESQFSESKSLQKELSKSLGRNIQDLQKETDWTTEHQILNQAKVQFENIKSLDARLNDQKVELENQIHTISDQKAKTTLLESFEKNTLHQNLSDWAKSINTKIKDFQDQLTHSTWDEYTFDSEIERVKNLIGLQKESIKLEEKIKVRQTELIAFTEKIKGLEQQIEVEEKQTEYAQLQLKEKQATVNRLEFECSNHAIRLRSELVEDKPCAVCGSLEHPYADKDISEEQQILKSAKNAVTELEKQIQFLTKTIQNSQLTKAKVEGEVNNKETELIDTKSQLEECKQEFADLFAKTEKLTLTEKEDLELVQINLENQRKALKEIERYTSLQTQFSSLQNQVSSYQKNEEEYQSIISPYETYLDKGATSLKNWVETFIQKEASIENLKSAQVRLQSQLESGQTELQKLEKEIGLSTEKLNEEHSLIKAQKEVRSELFGNKLVKQERQKYLTEKDKLKDSQHTIIQKLIELKATLSELTKNTTETLSLQEKTHNSFTEISKELQSSLVARNFKDIKELQEAILKEDFVTRISNKRKELEHLKIELQTSKIATEERILKYKTELPQNTDITLEDLSAEISEKEDIQKEHQSLIGQETQKIKQSAQNELKAQDQDQVLNEKENDLKIWQTLNKLIGDSKGNTFNNYAQSLMLNILLEYANKHLTDLNKRYLFTRIPKGGNTDDLYIKDMEMGGEERAIRTLSGGETFLLSLSLALGLSDMASQSVRIESLFIDEGFGTLDKETLEEVLSTLEVLQNKTGKKIMIISHVPELQERISTQIQLKKLGNGYSQMNIIPN